MARETKYYFVDFAITPSLKEINPEEIVEFVKDGKATENWIFMQIDGTIRYVFGKYNMPYPKCVFVNRNYKRTYEMDLVVVRENLKNEKEAMKWNVQRMFIQDELNRQAQSNSDDEGLKYKFEVI
jgi:isocitrate dehydrogenase